MKELTKDEEEIVSHLKASLWQTVVSIIDQETQALGTTVTPTYTAALVQLVFDQLVSVGEDLEAFAKHAKRKTVIAEDVYMVTRKNRQLTEILRGFAEQELEGGEKTTHQKTVSNQNKSNSSNNNKRKVGVVASTGGANGKEEQKKVGDPGQENSTTVEGDKDDTFESDVFDDDDDDDDDGGGGGDNNGNATVGNDNRSTDNNNIDEDDEDDFSDEELGFLGTNGQRPATRT